jgi:hypothetical protein
MADKFAAQVPELEEKAKDGFNKLHAKELSIIFGTNYQNQ